MMFLQTTGMNIFENMYSQFNLYTSYLLLCEYRIVIAYFLLLQIIKTIKRDASISESGIICSQINGIHVKFIFSIS
jgi:hypothetical protein